MSDNGLIDVPVFNRPAIKPLSHTEAEILLSYSGDGGVLKRYDMATWYRCMDCAQTERLDGCLSEFNSKIVRIICRCTIREYQPSKGVTTLAMNRANSALILANKATAYDMQNGEVVEIPTILMEREDAAIARLFERVIRNLRLQAFTIHTPCWNKKYTDYAAMEVHITPDQIGYKCKCRMLFHQGQSLAH